MTDIDDVAERKRLAELLVAKHNRPPPIKEKFCNKCNKSRPVFDFYKNINTRDGLMAMCKECSSKYYRMRTEQSIFKENEERNNVKAPVENELFSKEDKALTTLQEKALDLEIEIKATKIKIEKMEVTIKADKENVKQLQIMKNFIDRQISFEKKRKEKAEFK
jgi:hypothetical protein